MVFLFGAKKKRPTRKISVCYMSIYSNLSSYIVANYKVNVVFRLEEISWVQKNLKELNMFFFFQILWSNFAWI